MLGSRPPFIPLPLYPPQQQPKRNQNKKTPNPLLCPKSPTESLNPIVSPSRRAALSGLFGLAVSLVSPSLWSLRLVALVSVIGSQLSLSLVSPSLARSTRLSVLLLEIANEVSPDSVTEISEFQQTVVKENGNSEVEVSHHRVYLLGENRWEEPSRLNGKAGRNNTPVGTTKCLECRGEGRVLCMECDGTGEPNIEPQSEQLTA
ncbi:hypothetical protein Syun_017198 [Stephania yunnanensis]|uniref:Uncharacterized protein n=1 Tax=Stephania yunnanensis TaxID=152371 RepID=A0AAP0J8R3_9MAGN